MSLVIGLQHDDELAGFGLAMDFNTLELFDIIFYGLQAIGAGMHDHARDMNFH
jgi:hypothetical protein